MKGYYNCLKCIKISFPVVEGLILKGYYYQSWELVNSPLVVEGLILKGYYNLNILEMH